MNQVQAEGHVRGGDAHPPGSPDLQQEKLRSEIKKIGLEVELLRRQRQRGGLPPWWEVLKTLVPWISVVVGALAFTTGYLHSLRQEEQTLLKGATDYYLGDHPEVGADLLSDLVKPPWIVRRFSSATADSERIVRVLIGGIDVNPHGNLESDELNHRRNMAALDALERIGAVSDPRLCPQYSVARTVVEAQLDSYETGPEQAKNEAQQSAIRRTVEFLCTCTRRSLLDAHCEIESWQNYKPEIHSRFLEDWKDVCIKTPA